MKYKIAAKILAFLTLVVILLQLLGNEISELSSFEIDNMIPQVTPYITLFAALVMNILANRSNSNHSGLPKNPVFWLVFLLFFSATTLFIILGFS